MNRIDEYLIKWNLLSPVEVARTTTSHVYRVTFENALAILKLLTPLGRKFESSGPQALKYFDGKGAVKLLNFDEGAHLLEHVDGNKLAVLVGQGNDTQAANVICDVMNELHCNSGQRPAEIHDLKRQFQSLFLRAKNESDNSIFYKTAKIAEKLVSSEVNRKLLHGDLHHTNILKSSSRGWLAIDPQSLFGERTYDVANSFFNPDDMPEIVETKDRIEFLAEIFSERLKTDRRRILEFAYAHGGLSSSWQLDDGENPQRRLRITSIIETLL